MLVETGVSFTPNATRWLSHKVAVDADFVRAHLDEPAINRFDALTAQNKIMVVRAVTEVSVARYRETRKDPDFTPGERETWLLVLEKLIGSEGWSRLGV